MQLLWATAHGPSRGPKPALSLEAVIDAALGIADREGLSALTMARVAQELKVTTMATYRYVPSKEELIDLMIEHPDLLQRPIVERGERAVLGRPTENVKELLT